MKIGIIGAGGVAKAHLTALSFIPDVTKVYIYDISCENAKKLQELHLLEVELCDTCEDLINLADAVIIAAPNHLHYQYTKLALENNKHVLCEKPLATSYLEGLKMFRESRRRSKISAVGFNYRFLPVVKTLKKLIEEETFGNILSMQLEYKRDSSLSRKIFTWRDSKLSNKTSGALGDLGVHLVDLIYFLNDKPVDLTSLLFNLKTNVKEKEQKPVEVDDYAEVHGRVYNGPYFNLIVSKSSPEDELGLKISVTGTKAEFKYHSADKNIFYLRKFAFWEERTAMPEHKIDDPKREIFGWSFSFIEQAKAWVSEIIGRSKLSNNFLATFVDGINTQKALQYILCPSYKEI